MNFKRFHESKNLFDKNDADIYLSTNINATNNTWNAYSGIGQTVRIPCSANTTYAISIDSALEQTIFRILLITTNNTPTDGNSVSGTLVISSSDDNTAVFTTLANTKYLVLQVSSAVFDDAIDSLMLNFGSTPLPYEPYSSEVWHDTPHYIHNTSTDTITTLPAVLYPNDTTATVGLKGQMSQTGTPSPSSPIQPNECGERTGNRFDKSTDIVAYYLTQTTGVYTATSSTSRSVLIPCEPSKTYTVHVPTNRTLRIVEFDHYPQGGDAGSNYVSQETGSYIDKDVTVTTTATAKYLCVFCYNSAQEATQYTESAYFAQVMVVEGSTAPSSYIPYGYKIPISNGQQTTNIYLGSTQTVRQVKKLVLTGEESGWQLYQQSSPIWQYEVYQFWLDNIIDSIQYSSLYSTIAPFGVTSQNRHNYEYGCYAVSSGKGIAFQMAGAKDVYPTLTAWKTYLQQQYANGTPVTVWYVLNAPETAVVNEPLMKIGDYADEVSGITIPVTAGANTISVGTTLQPSEVTVNYKGWHPVSAAHERSGGSWT